MLSKTMLNKALSEEKQTTAAINDRFILLGVAIDENKNPVFSSKNMSDVIWFGLAQSFSDNNQINMQMAKELGTMRTYYISDGTINNSYNLTGVMLGDENYLAKIYGSVKISENVPDIIKPGFTTETSNFFVNLQSFIFRKSFSLIIAIANPELSILHSQDYYFSVIYSLDGATINNYNVSVQTGNLVVYENLSGNYVFKRMINISPHKENDVSYSENNNNLKFG